MATDTSRTSGTETVFLANNMDSNARPVLIPSNFGDLDRLKMWAYGSFGIDQNRFQITHFHARKGSCNENPIMSNFVLDVGGWSDNIASSGGDFVMAFCYQDRALHQDSLRNDHLEPGSKDNPLELTDDEVVRSRQQSPTPGYETDVHNTQVVPSLFPPRKLSRNTMLYLEGFTKAPWCVQITELEQAFGRNAVESESFLCWLRKLSKIIFDFNRAKNMVCKAREERHRRSIKETTHFQPRDVKQAINLASSVEQQYEEMKTDPTVYKGKSEE